jgi:hypothetical protein
VDDRDLGERGQRLLLAALGIAGRGDRPRQIERDLHDGARARLVNLLRC